MATDTSLLKNWIRENPERAPNAKVVAAMHGFNVDTVRKEFHRKEGITFGRFIADVRFEYVKRLLLTTDKNCFGIATELQLRDDVLSRWFKARTGMTMEEFRRKNGKPQNSAGGGQNLKENNPGVRTCKLILQTTIANRNSKENFLASHVKNFLCFGGPNEQLLWLLYWTSHFS